MNKKYKVSKSCNWTGVRNLTLDDFAGKGNQFIGFRLCLYPDGKYRYYYNWVKVKLSQSKETLWVIESACNRTKNNSILTGQK